MHTNKGCYIGQELIQRSTHVGVVRKQTYPFLVFEKGQVEAGNFAPLNHCNKDFKDNLVDAEVKTENHVIVGKVMAQQWNAGVAMINLPKLMQQTPETRYFVNNYPVLLWQSAWQRMRDLRDKNDPEYQE